LDPSFFFLCLANKGILSRWGLGFGRVLAALTATQRPVIGHNCITDLQLMFGQFIGPVPINYATFKQELHALFPALYDTKHMAASMGKRLPKKLETGANLQRLYAALGQDCVDAAGLKPPTVQLTEESSRYCRSTELQ
jgi:poly(A)-specific ribonuclease